ncbi:MAG: sugar phosphate isomerase/epimerase [Phycisphaerae bacterium]|nr:sugar phosphate isomerase/epimerase [Phycisphaerae bacterium]
MKIGFTSRVCPEWDLETIVTKAAELEYDGVELGALEGETHLPASPALTRDPEAVKDLFAGKGVELACLGTAETLEAYSSQQVAASRERVMEVIELAGRLACPFVRVPIGNVPGGDKRDRTLSRLAAMFESFARRADEHQVTLLIENGGDYPASDDLWFVVDHVAHPAVAACWNPCPAMTRLERPTTSIPRLGRMLKIARVCDGIFDYRGRFGGFKVPGEGDVQLSEMVTLLRGIIYQGYLMFDWPKAAVPELPAAEVVLPRVHQQLREWIDTISPPLTAYKGDKKPVQLNLPVAM